MQNIIALVIVMLTIAPTAASAVGGQLDLLFGDEGFAIVTAGSSSTGRAVAVQPDGKFAIAGNADLNRHGDTGFGLARMSANGVLDPTFGDEGLVITPFPPTTLQYAMAYAVALQTDGKIVAVGPRYAGSGDNGAEFDVAMARYNTDGSLDAAFGSNGLVMTSLAGLGKGGLTQGVVVQPDGKIVVGTNVLGGVSPMQHRDFVLVRYQTDGTLDTGFGSGGFVVTPSPPPATHGALAALSHDSITGHLMATGGDRLIRYDADGNLDLAFGIGGEVATPFGTEAIIVQPDGKIVVAGTKTGGVNFDDFALARYDTSGALDGGFGSAGTVVTDLGLGADNAYALFRQSDGKLIAAGRTTAGLGDYGVGLVRYGSAGAVDPDFGDNGVVVTGFDNDHSGEARAVFEAADGRIVAVGTGAGKKVSFTAIGYTNPVCGDSIVAGGEECDDGNALNGDCCSSICLYESSSGACDPCASGALAVKPQLTITKLNTFEADDKLTLKGTISIPTVPVVDPITNGLVFLLEDNTGFIKFYQRLPGGAYNPSTQVGWMLKPNGRDFVYVDKLGVVSRIKMMSLKGSSRTPGTHKVNLQIKNGAFPIDPGLLPLKATVSLEVPTATMGQCAEFQFPGVPPAGCNVNESFSRLKCK